MCGGVRGLQHVACVVQHPDVFTFRVSAGCGVYLSCCCNTFIASLGALGALENALYSVVTHLTLPIIL